jgi:hypothetical protein
LKIPHFIPVLTAFAARVSGLEPDRLLQSPTTLARALADTQSVVGHDGVLSIYAPTLLLTACVDANHSMAKPADEVLRSRPLATVLESIPILRHVLPDRATVFATFAGPGLLHRQLREAVECCADSDWDVSSYVAEVILAAVRSSLDVKADGIALIEQATPAMPAEMQRVHRKVRKLADFYGAAFLVFYEQETEEQGPELPAHCVFDLGPRMRGIGPVMGRLGQSAAAESRPYTTAGDVPADTAVNNLKALNEYD